MSLEFFCKDLVQTTGKHGSLLPCISGSAWWRWFNSVVLFDFRNTLLKPHKKIMKKEPRKTDLPELFPQIWRHTFLNITVCVVTLSFFLVVTETPQPKINETCFWTWSPLYLCVCQDAAIERSLTRPMSALCWWSSSWKSGTSFLSRREQAIVKSVRIKGAFEDSFDAEAMPN